MPHMFSLYFSYNGSSFKALIRLKERASRREYHVTIMNGQLERLLYGSHIFVEVDHHLQIADDNYSQEVAALRSIIGDTLSTYLKQSHFSD